MTKIWKWYKYVVYVAWGSRGYSSKGALHRAKCKIEPSGELKFVMNVALSAQELALHRNTEAQRRVSSFCNLRIAMKMWIFFDLRIDMIQNQKNCSNWMITVYIWEYDMLVCILGHFRWEKIPIMKSPTLFYITMRNEGDLLSCFCC